MRRPQLVAVLGAVCAVATVAAAMTDEERRAHLEWMQRTLPDVSAWNEWQQRTGAMPPDFDALPRSGFLPEPFTFAKGGRVQFPADWPERRAEIRRAFEQFVVGSLPPKPALGRVVPVSERAGDGYVTRVVRLEYGPENKATTEVTMTLPAGSGPFPVLIGNGWAPALIRRGYASCSYSGSVDQKSNLPALYPNFDFASMGQRAWTAQMVVDYLVGLPEVDRGRIAITGYSREGKMATLAAALDERIAAVIAGSTGVGGVLPWRLAGEQGMGEGVESTTRMFPAWFAPQLRFFAGREDRLPVDANLLVALIAPRACLMQYGLNDEVSNVWANEQCYRSALPVYEAFGQAGRLGLLRLPGFHGANDQERCLDWLDIQFGRSSRKWDQDLLFPWDFAAWKAAASTRAAPRSPPAATALTAASSAEWERRAADVRRGAEWILGEAPPRLPPPAGRAGMFGRGPAATATKPVPNPGQLAPDVPGWVIARNISEFGWTGEDRAAADSRRIRFHGLTGDLYFPVNTPAEAKLPTVIWLHGYSYPLGYMWVYRRDTHPILALVKAGHAVLAFDQCGFGARMAESGPFYDRYPHWSQLGRMVEDVRAAIDALEKEAIVDRERIHLFGYTLGGAVALHAAALEPRVKSVVSVMGFTPWRTDAAARDRVLARWAIERPIAPRLGLYLGRERDVPYDYDGLIATIAPRPVLVVQPTRDRNASPADVRAAVEAAKKIYALYDSPERLALQEPDDYRFSGAAQAAAIDWLKQVSTP